MLQFLQTTYNRVIGGEQISLETANRLARCPDQQALFSLADAVRLHFTGNRFHLCSIINSRSGNCTENCRFCAQSARYQTGVTAYSMVDHGQAMHIAMDNQAHGVHRLSLVTSGHSLDRATLDQLGKLYREIQDKTDMACCASMGFLTPKRAKQLAELGVSRYHCNLESNQARFSEICTSHSWQDKVDTLKIAEKAGMSLCSGGIIGMGESMDDRIELAFELYELGVQSIPINLLTPIEGTPLAATVPLPLQEVLTTIALFRFINPRATIRLAGGRQQLAPDQYRCFAAGANGAIVGNFLTTSGSSISRDLNQLRAMGFYFSKNKKFSKKNSDNSDMT